MSQSRITTFKQLFDRLRMSYAESVTRLKRLQDSRDETENGDGPSFDDYYKYAAEEEATQDFINQIRGWCGEQPYFMYAEVDDSGELCVYEDIKRQPVVF